MKPFRARTRRPTEPKACSRKTCCTDNPGAETTAACFNVGACGCQVVAHPEHPTPSFTAASPAGAGPAAQGEA